MTACLKNLAITGGDDNGIAALVSNNDLQPRIGVSTEDIQTISTLKDWMKAPPPVNDQIVALAQSANDPTKEAETAKKILKTLKLDK